MLDLVQALKAAEPPKEAAFEDGEYLARIERARTAMRSRGLDVLIVRNVANISYLSGYLTQMTSWYVTLVVPAEGSPFIHVNEGETALVLIHGPIDDVVTIPWRRSADAPEDLAKVIRERGLARKSIGIESRCYPFNVDTYLRIRQALPEAQFADASDLVFELRLVKSADELAHMRKAGSLTASGIDAALDQVRLGNSENDVAAAAYARMVRCGSEHLSHAPIVQAGERSGWAPTITWKRAPLAPGSPVVIGLTGAWYRYGAPRFSTAVIGEADDETRRLASAAAGALTALLEAAKPGRSFHDLAQIGQRALRSAQLNAQFDGTFGQSVGLGLVPSWKEGPIEVRDGMERALEPGMTFYSEIGLRIPGKKGVAFGDTWAVTDRGCEIFTSGRRELVVNRL